MQALIINIMNKFGYLGIMLLIAIENIFPPIPSEVILTFGGFMTKRPNSQINIIGVIIFATIGSIIGALLLYFIGRLLNKEKLKKIVSGKVGKILRLKPKDIEMADTWFDNKGNKTVFFCRFIPIVRSLISIPAGMSDMPFSKFLLYTVLGSIGWNTILVVSGSIVGEKWEAIVTVFDNYTKIVLILLVILFIIAVTLFYNKRKIKK
jgi:membrane protein DedA with SNARE-associated domain